MQATKGWAREQAGFTLVEITVSLVVIAIIALSMLMLYASMVSSQALNKRRAVASTLATNQMEYLKSLPYNSLAVEGGSIVSSDPLSASTKKVINGAEYTIVTSINYVDDAYDGCGSYPTPELKELYCRNYPAPDSAPPLDTNNSDYKIIHVSVSGPTGVKFAEVDTQVSARVAETASTTGGLFVTIVDNTGNPVSGATVQVTNTVVNQAVNVSDQSDNNGIAVFYGLPPDVSNYNYAITASLTGYSTISTIAPSGSLQPNYSNQRIFTQQSSLVTLIIQPQGRDSLLLETTNTSGTPLGNVKVYSKGGYKKYVDSSDTSYYYDTLSPIDSRPQSNSSGLVGVKNLVPGPYYLCGDNGDSGCTIGGTTYYLAAAVPYAGTSPFNPVTVPALSSSGPPAITFSFEGGEYLQKVRLLLTTNANYPRIKTISPADVSLSSGTINAFNFQIDGVNLPCNANPASCQTTVTLKQGANTYNASCVGDTNGYIVNCSVDMSGAVVGLATLVISSNGNTLTLPGSPMIGGINVTP